MTRLLLVLVAALCAAPAALADGIAPFATQGGPGVLAPDGSARFVALSARGGTRVVRIDAGGGAPTASVTVRGAFGVPVATYDGASAEGVSPDGKTLVLGDVVHTWPHAHSSFLFLDPRTLHVRGRVSLRGDFAFDALSPNGDRLYLIQHMSSADTTRYVVRAFDVRTMRLQPGRIADRTQRSWVMEGYPLNRVTSADGRWVYTLYGNARNVPFVHALDTVKGVAHCIGLPWRGSANAPYNLRLSLTGATLRVHWLSGRPWLRVDTRTWRISADRHTFPWWTLWLLGLLPIVALGLLRDRAARAHQVLRVATRTS